MLEMQMEMKTEESQEATTGRRTPDLEKSQRCLRQAEDFLCGPVITYWDSVRGEITDDDVEALRALLWDVPHTDQFFLCLTSTGGSGLASLRIAHFLRQRCKRLIVLVPTQAASAATFLALAANEIQLAPLAALSPIDGTIHHSLSPTNQANDPVGVGQIEIERILTLWKKESKTENSNPYAELWHYIHPLVIGAIDRSNSLSIKLCDALLSFHMPDKDSRQKIAEMLATAYPTHSYPILLPEAREMGLPVVEMDHELEIVLTELQQCYSKAGIPMRTEQDQDHHHDDEIGTIVESTERMILFRIERDWYYRNEEHRWMPMNAIDAWFQAELREGEMLEKRLFLR
jgi:hypothetical protein